MIKLTSSDGQEFSVPREVASLSILIKNMLEDFGEDYTDTPIPLPNVSGPILAKGLYLCLGLFSYLFSLVFVNSTLPRKRS